MIPDGFLPIIISLAHDQTWLVREPVNTVSNFTGAGILGQRGSALFVVGGPICDSQDNVLG